MANNVIRFFEHERWSVEERFLDYFDSLAAFNERHAHRFFDVGNRTVKFKSYVGVIQVGGLTIEILPKLDRITDDKSKMHRNLIAMLHRIGMFPPEDAGSASLSGIGGNMFEFYLNLFLREVQRIVRFGLPKQYSPLQGNERFMHGHLLMRQHLTRNIFDRSRFYVEFQSFSKNHLMNQILKQALRIIAGMPVKAALDAHNLLTFFETVDDRQIHPCDFRHLKYTRNNECCRTAVGMAELIISNHQPDLRHGNMSITSLLFDMNRLFERYVAHDILRHAKDKEIKISLQRQHLFWRSDGSGAGRTVRPDIVISKNGKTFILDTKWKLPERNEHSDADLRQIYTYSIQWNTDRVILIYPAPGPDFESFDGSFSASNGIHDRRPASIWKVPILTEDSLNKDLGRDILERLFPESVLPRHSF